VYSGDVLFPEDGVYSVNYWAQDLAGNTEPTSTIQFYIDQTPPVTTLTIHPPFQGTEPTYISPETEFSLEALDELSGLGRTEYRIDMGEWLLYDSLFTVQEIGPHTVYYRSIDVAGNMEIEQSVQVVVQEYGQYEITYTGDVLGTYSDPACLEAFLIDVAAGLPVAGMTVFFAVGGQTASAVTDSNGYASATIILMQQPGVYQVSAWIEEDGETVVSSESMDFTIERESAYVYYTGATVVPVGADSITLRATVYEDQDGFWGDITQILVTFRIYDESVSTSVPIVTYGPFAVHMTEIDGLGVFTVDVPNLPEGIYLVEVSLDDSVNGYYEGTSDLVSLVVYVPGGEFMTGAGWIRDTSGSKGHFVVLVKHARDGQLWGAAFYTFSEDGLRYVVATVDITGFFVDGNHAFFEATCVICYCDRDDREGGRLEGTYTLRIDVWINAEGRCRPRDVFQILVFDENGQIWHEAGFDPYGVLQGGNIVIHAPRDRGHRRCHMNPRHGHHWPRNHRVGAKARHMPHA
jgi:hypothetical protein